MSEENKDDANPTTSHVEESFYFDDKLLEPYHYLVNIPGKKIRTKLIQVI